MKKLNFWLLASLFVGSLAFTACSSSDDDGPAPQPGPSPAPAPTPVNPSDMTMAKLSGFVYEGTYPISGVKVTSGTASTTTNENGAFTLPQVNVNSKNRVVVKFEKNGYIDVVRSEIFKEGDVWDVKMKYQSSSYFTPTASTTIQPDPYSNPNMKVEIPANSLQTTDGSPITGQVSAATTYLDPNDEGFESQMPGGDLIAIRTDGSDAQLVSYGMVSVTLTDDAGKSVNLKSGQTATITFPAPAGLEAHDQIPLWYFDEEQGLWVEEGMATKQADGTYVGTVSHFSWHNLDYPETRANLSVSVKDETGAPVAFQRVVYGQSSATTNKDGYLSVYVPTNTAFKVSVKSADYANYTPEVSQDVAKITTAGSTVQVNLVLPKLAHLNGTITSNGQGVQASVNVSYNGGETKAVMSAVDGKYYINLPASHVGAATLNIMAADGTIYRKNITLTGADMTENYEISPAYIPAGSVTFTSTDGSVVVTKTISDLPAFTFGGILTLGGDMINYQNYSSKDGYLSFSKNSSRASFSLYTYGDVHESLYTKDDNFNLDYTVNGTTATVTISGKAVYSNHSTTYEGTVTGSFPYTVLAQFNTGANPPSWVPTVSGSTPNWSYNFANSPKLGDGWILFYNNGEDVNKYYELVNAAKATFGEPYESMDDPEDPDEYYKTYIFIKDGRGLQLGFCKSPYDGWEPYLDNILGGHHGWSEVSITIRAFSNITVPYDDVFSGHYR